MPREEVFGLPVNLFLMLLFVAIFSIIAILLTPQIREGIIAFLFNSLRELSKWIGGV